MTEFKPMDNEQSLPYETGEQRLKRYDNSVYTLSNPKHIDLEKVQKLVLADYHLTPEDVQQYLFGITVEDPKTGELMAEATWEHFIEQAVSQTEHSLGIKILPRIVGREYHDFYPNDFSAHNYFRTNLKPIIQVLEVATMGLDNKKLISYPPSSWKVYHLTGELKTFPAALASSLAGTSTGLGADTGLALTMMSGDGGYYGMSRWGDDFISPQRQLDAPQATYVSYVAGMLPPQRKNDAREWEMPEDLYKLIIERVKNPVLENWGDLIIGAGIAGTSISMDGISESISTTQSAEFAGAGARMKQIDQNIKDLEASLRNYYGYNSGVF